MGRVILLWLDEKGEIHRRMSWVIEIDLGTNSRALNAIDELPVPHFDFYFFQLLQGPPQMLPIAAIGLFPFSLEPRSGFPISPVSENSRCSMGKTKYW